MTQISSLANADGAAMALPQTHPGSIAVSCAAKSKVGQAIEVQVVGEDGAPLEGVAVELKRNATQVMTSRTRLDGIARFEPLDHAGYEIGLSELDAGAWEPAGTSALTLSTVATSEPDWRPRAPTARPAFTHSAIQGECIARLAHRFGFFPATIWGHERNLDLADKRRDQNVLYRGDEIYIPEKQSKRIDGVVGQRYVLKRKGIPEVLRLRFLRNGRPRVDEPYQLALTSSDGTAHVDRCGVIDHDGYILEFVSPAITLAKVTLGQGTLAEVHRFRVSHLNPIDTISGVKGRLQSLGYYTGTIDELTDDALRSAVAAFQADNRVTPDGEVTEKAFVSALKRVYGS